MKSPLPMLIDPSFSRPLCGCLNSTSNTTTVPFNVRIPTNLPVLFGKHQKCHVKFGNPELADFHFAISGRLVKDPKLSEHRFQTIIQANETQEPTFLNGIRLKHGTHSVRDLSNGDTIAVRSKETGKIIVECIFTSFTPNTLPSAFETIKMLGKGTFGEVVKCKERATGNFVAVKRLMKPDEEDPSNVKAKERIKQEVQMAQRLSTHENIIRLHKVFEDQESTYIVMELAPANSLDKLLAKKKFLSERHAQWITLDVGKALAFIHENEIIHRDIKPANILMMSIDPPVAKVGDLGLARKVSGHMSIAGTPYYMAPEALSHEYDCKVDCFSLGAIVFKMLTGITPFPSKDLDINFGRRYFRDDRQTPRFDQAPEGTLNQKSADFIRRILILEPEKMEKMSKILRHVWLRGIPLRQLDTEPGSSEMDVDQVE